MYHVTINNRPYYIPTGAIGLSHKPFRISATVLEFPAASRTHTSQMRGERMLSENSKEISCRRNMASVYYFVHVNLNNTSKSALSNKLHSYIVRADIHRN